MSRANGDKTTGARKDDPTGATGTAEVARDAWIRTAFAQIILDRGIAAPQQRAVVREALGELGCHAGEARVELHLLAD